MRKRWITLILVAVVIIFAIVIMSVRGNGHTDKDVVKCIGAKSTLYVQLGCHACEKQEDLFGNNTAYLNIVDCYYEREKCPAIEYTPTWIINGNKYVGVHSVEDLQKLTGC